MGFLWILHGPQALDLMAKGAREATEGELEGEFLLFLVSC